MNLKNESELAACVRKVLTQYFRDLDGETASNVYDMVIQCADSFVTLANLRNGSIKKQPGDRVSLVGVIATVGNSGSPSIPHLHIRAARGGWRPGMGTGIPMLFDGAYAVNQFATRNKIFVP